jgi:sugar phosphate isomerase/epimerase
VASNKLGGIVNMSKNTQISRRDLIRTSAAVLAATGAAEVFASDKAEAQATDPAAGTDSWHGLKVSVASYTFRKQTLEETIKGINRTGLKYVSIKDVHLPFNTTALQRKEIAQKFIDAGITPLSCGNVSMKNDEADVRRAFDYARDIGLPTIVCAPHPDSMPILDKMVKEYDIRLAIHNHGPEDKRFPSPETVWNAAKPYDKRIGLCIDVGHAARAGADPAADILRYRERLYDMHFKDISNVTPRGAPMEVGRGVLNTQAMLENLLSIHYTHLVSFEYEKNDADPLPGLMESMGYTRGILHGLKGTV